MYSVCAIKVSLLYDRYQQQLLLWTMLWIYLNFCNRLRNEHTSVRYGVYSCMDHGMASWNVKNIKWKHKPQAKFCWTFYSVILWSIRVQTIEKIWSICFFITWKKKTNEIAFILRWEKDTWQSEIHNLLRCEFWHRSTTDIKLATYFNFDVTDDNNIWLEIKTDKQKNFEKNLFSAVNLEQPMQNFTTISLTKWANFYRKQHLLWVGI